MAYETISWTCSCFAGYIFWTDISWNESCINWNSYCRDEYWSHVSYNSINKKCECDIGYTFKTDNYWNIKCEKKEINVYFWLLDLNKSDKTALIYDIYSKNRFAL